MNPSISTVTRPASGVAAKRTEGILDGNLVRFGFLGCFVLALFGIDPPVDAAVNKVGWLSEFRVLVACLGMAGVAYIWLRMIAAARGDR